MQFIKEVGSVLIEPEVALTEEQESKDLLSALHVVAWGDLLMCCNDYELIKLLTLVDKYEGGKRIA